jgi:cold shock CspA family protein
MARSQETSTKKDREKKRVLKNKDKEQRREERKANNSKGKTLEDMMAYVDENGRISSTPPDPAKKKQIKLDDIQLGAAKPVVIDPAERFRTGTVTFFNDAKGFGFIKDSVTQESVFVHINAIQGGAIKENDKVSFEIEMGIKGTNAVNVKPVV